MTKKLIFLFSLLIASLASFANLQDPLSFNSVLSILLIVLVQYSGVAILCEIFFEEI